ncbi:MAG: hypothetical protein CL808_06160 [Citromicrobium sp.]|nr:hypothetical protein [Citromicrobium sp.]
MAFDLDLLTSTPDIRTVAPVHARLVCALRYTHLARKGRSFCCDDLADQLGAPLAVHAFLVFLDEAGRAWPEPIVLNPPCQPRMSYDEMLLVDCATAAAKNDRASFDSFLCDMLDRASRASVWNAARRLMSRMEMA